MVEENAEVAQVVDSNQPIVDPIEFEKQMLAEAEQKANDPAEQAAQMFKAYKKGFELSVEKLSAKSVKRLIKALVLAPLEKAPLVNQNEHEAYFYANSMLEAKFIMTLTAMNHSSEEILAGYEDLQKEVTTDVIYGDEAKNENS